MEPDELEERFRSFLRSWKDEDAGIDAPNLISGTTAYLVHSFDREALQFSIPILIRRALPDESELDPGGLDGAVGTLIEEIKELAGSVHAMGPLYGRGTVSGSRYQDTIEPYTIIHSDASLGAGLWKADNRNFCDVTGVHLVLRGVLPAPAVPGTYEGRRMIRQMEDLAGSVAEHIRSCPLKRLEPAWIASLDQKLLREELPERGLVAFVGDGSRLARSPTRLRPFFRVAGPKNGVSVPFTCPKELDPVEIELPASNRSVTGLGIRQREVLAVAGSNAQGKTTFLEGILAGMDDHAPHDGRELVVTARGACIAESTNIGLAGADISMFFHALPPGVAGTVRAVHGMGSGSMTMAHQVQSAITRHAPLLIIDEDRAAPNLLVKSCLQKEEITPLSEILAHQRERMADTALVFAACAMDTLIAQADRIMVLDRHVASGINPGEFRHTVAGHLRKMADGME